MEKKNEPIIKEYKVKNYLSIYRPDINERLVKYLEKFCADGFLDKYYGMIIYPRIIKIDIQAGEQSRKMRSMLNKLLKEAEKNNASMIFIWDV